jgi:hypothetical protein
VNNNGHPVAARRLDLKLAPDAGKIRFTNGRHKFSFASQKGSIPFLFEFALAEFAGVKLSGPLARIDGLLTTMRTPPRRFHNPVGGQRPVWVHSSSMTDHLSCPWLCEDVLKDIWASRDWLKQSGEGRDPV